MIASDYVSGNRIYSADVPKLITHIHASLLAITRQAPPEQAQFRPSAAQIAASVKRNRIISFIDGKPCKSLKWQLAAHGLTPDQYRARFGLPDTYPMVAPAYDRSLACTDIRPNAKPRK